MPRRLLVAAPGIAAALDRRGRGLFTDPKTVTVTLKRGKWKYYCSIHESLMFGFFTVK
jgi:plastocyanin